MEKTDKRYQAYIDILREELIPAMGCTEPIAVAYAAAAARNTLGELPDKVLVEASGSMIKNVKSVIVPNTDNMKGLEAAAAAGIVAGKQEKKLEVIADVTPEQTKAIRAYLDQTDIKVRHVENGVTFDIILTVWKGEHSAQVRIAVFHTNIVHVEKDGEVLVDIPVHGDNEEIRYMAANDVECNMHYPVPCHLQKAYANLGYQPGDCPNAEYLAAHCVTLPLFPEMREDEIARVIDLCNAYRQA